VIGYPVRTMAAAVDPPHRPRARCAPWPACTRLVSVSTRCLIYGSLLAQVVEFTVYRVARLLLAVNAFQLRHDGLGWVARAVARGLVVARVRRAGDHVDAAARGCRVYDSKRSDTRTRAEVRASRGRWRCGWRRCGCGHGVW